MLIGVYDLDKCADNFRGENGGAHSGAHIATGKVDYRDRELVGRREKGEMGTLYILASIIPHHSHFMSTLTLCSTVPPHECCCLLLIKTL